MVSPISSRARSYARARTTQLMTATCRIERVQKPTYATDSLLGSPGSREVLYEGVCRLWEVTGASAVIVGETDISMQTTQLSIPWDTAVEIKRHDEVVMVTSPHDPQVVGRRFEIQTVAKAGELRATRRFTVSMVQDQA